MSSVADGTKGIWGRALHVLLLLSGLSCAAGLQAEEPRGAPAPPVQIVIRNFMFAPQRVTLKAGATLRWANQDEEPHTVMSVEGLFRSPAVDGGEHFEFRFEKPGTYRYFCTIHPNMTGTVIVQ